MAWVPGRGEAVGLAVHGGIAAIAAAGREPYAVDIATLADLDRDARPRWVTWSPRTATATLDAGVALTVGWELSAVTGILHADWRADPARVWARAAGLAPPRRQQGPPDLFAHPLPDADVAVLADGSLHPEWSDGAWAESPDRMGAWAGLGLEVFERQRAQLRDLTDHPTAEATAHAESTAELLCVELASEGLPFDAAEAERLVAALVGPRPRDEREAADQRDRRDASVLRHAPAGMSFPLRNPAHVKALLRACGVEVPDTRAWRLESLRESHPVVDALLAWRRAERFATTFGYGWIGEHVGADGRLRGEWTASDGAAGRMTASAGLHNMPAELRSAVVAAPGHRFVRADLGQVEPRVLAAVSGDAALARATAADDLYLPVARDLGVDRATAKVAVLGAMYGQTTGHGAAALRRLDRAYPVAMALLRDAAAAGQAGRDLRTWGGRLVRLDAQDGESADRGAQRAAARGRYARNALIQGAAAELFKMWAATVRTRTRPLGARVVLCLHDELLVHAPAERATEVADAVIAGLDEAASRWAPGAPVRFVADVSIVERWSDAKD